MAARDFLRNNWPGVVIAVTAAAIACAAIIMVRSMPPRMIVMATGSEGGAYQEFGKRYRTELAGADVRVRLVPTAGSLELPATAAAIERSFFGPVPSSCSVRFTIQTLLPTL